MRSFGRYDVHLLAIDVAGLDTKAMHACYLELGYPDRKALRLEQCCRPCGERCCMECRDQEMRLHRRLVLYLLSLKTPRFLRYVP